jgi:hypothetical protein
MLTRFARRFSSGRSPKLAAFVALAGPLDLLTRFARRSSPFDRLRVRG